MTNVDPTIELQRALAEMAVLVRGGSVEVVTEHTMLLEARTKRHASQPRTAVRPRTGGPEGPRLLTGSYVGSIHSDVDVGAFSVSGTVGSNDVRARPLEFGNPNGFGRGIDIQSYPHYGPAMDEQEAEFLAAMALVPVAAAQKTRGGRVRSIIGRLFGRAS